MKPTFLSTAKSVGKIISAIPPQNTPEVRSGTSSEHLQENGRMRPLLKTGALLAIGVLLTILLSACGTVQKNSCPPDGIWQTGVPIGLAKFEIADCKITGPLYNILAGGSLSVIFPNGVECPIDPDGKFTCQIEGEKVTISGQFVSDMQAEGTLLITKGYSLGFGKLLEDIQTTWTAAPMAEELDSTKSTEPEDSKQPAESTPLPMPTRTNIIEVESTPTDEIEVVPPSPTTTLIPTQPPLLEAGSTQVSEKDGMTIVYIPEGEFLMGTSDTDQSDSFALPQHTVWLDAFWIDQTEVTNDQFSQFVNETGYLTEAERSGVSWFLDFATNNWIEQSGIDWKHPHGTDSNLDGLGNHPVVVVSWNDASAYCEWAGRRLPTEAEWEKAARGSDVRLYPWGSTLTLGNLLNFADKRLDASWADYAFDDGYRFTAPVGSYPDGASPYGALDMAGNVWEWVADWFGNYEDTLQRNPAGPSTGQERVERGGGWFNTLNSARTFARDYFAPSYTDANGGFRCAVDE